MTATRFKTRNRKRLKTAPTGVLKPGSAPKSAKNGAEIQRSAGSTTDHKRSPPPITIVGGSRGRGILTGLTGRAPKLEAPAPRITKLGAYRLGGVAELVETARDATPVAWGLPVQPGSKRASRRAPMALRTARLAAADHRNGRRRCPQALPVPLITRPAH